MNKIKLVSRCFRMVFQAAFVVIPLCLILYWVNAPTPLSLYANAISLDLLPHGANFPEFYQLSDETRMLGFAISLIPAGIILIVCYFLVKLFRLYEKNEFFSLENILYLRKVATTVIIGELIFIPLYQGLLSLVLTWHFHPHFVIITINFSILFFSFLLVLISWIMAEGYKLQEEQKYII